MFQSPSNNPVKPHESVLHRQQQQQIAGASKNIPRPTAIVFLKIDPITHIAAGRCNTLPARIPHISLVAPRLTTGNTDNSGLFEVHRKYKELLDKIKTNLDPPKVCTLKTYQVVFIIE